MPQLPPNQQMPGVYVAELPDVGSIPAASTAITAFLGRAARGPVQQAIRCGTYVDYERTFGGLSLDAPMSLAVRDFFVHGGTEALIVRIHHDQAETAECQRLDPAYRPTPVDPTAPPAHPDDVATCPLPATDPQLVLRAADPGLWANGLAVRFDRDGVTPPPGSALDPADLFNLTVKLSTPGAPDQTVTLLNVTLHPDGAARRLDRQEGLTGLLTVDALPAADVGRALITALTADPAWHAFTGGGAGAYLDAACFYTPADRGARRGLYALTDVEYDLLVIPRDRLGVEAALAYSEIFASVAQARAFWILEPPPAAWDAGLLAGSPPDLTRAYGCPPALLQFGAVYYPDLLLADPLEGGRQRQVGPAGAIAGLYAATDRSHGVWKAPAGTEAALIGPLSPRVTLTDSSAGAANTAAINPLRAFPNFGLLVWGARTAAGAVDNDGSRYIPERRLQNYIERSLTAGLRWTVFEPNDEPLWAKVRACCAAFLGDLWRSGGLAGATEREAFFVTCDASTTTTADQQAGVCKLLVGFALLRPAEFTILSLALRTSSGELAAPEP